ncbi:C40 family peptidase [Pseudonocardia acidicola]
MTMRDDRVPDLRTGGGRRRWFTTSTWALAALLGVMTFGTPPSASPVTTVTVRAASDSTAAAHGHPGDTPRTGGVLSGLLSGGSRASAPNAEPASTLQLRPAEFTNRVPDGRAEVAVQTAMAQIGLPYQWGGNGPANGDRGFDCSGLTTFSYAAAGIALPRTAQTQYNRGPHVTAGAPLQPGDLIFYGSPGKVHHVGMYIGDSRMVNAPTFGKPVQTAYYRWRGDDYLGATRPAATGVPLAGLLLEAPQASQPSDPAASPLIFDAPPAPLPRGPLPEPGVALPPEAVTAAAAIAAADEESAHTPSTVQLVVPIPGRPPADGSPGVVRNGPGAQPAAPSGTAGPFTAADPGTVPGGPTPGPGPGRAGPAPAGPPAPTTPPARTPSPASTTAGSAPSVAARSGTPAPVAPPPASTAAPRIAVPATATAATLPGGTVELAPVAQRATGLPEAPAGGGGVWSSGGHTVITLGSPALVDGVLVGAPITVRYSAGSTRTFTVRDRAVDVTSVAAARLLAAAPRGALVALAATGPGSWVVLTAA